MKDTKTLNIDAALHQVIKIRAAEQGIPIAIFAEMLLRIGLDQEQEIRRLLRENTSQESRPE